MIQVFFALDRDEQADRAAGDDEEVPQRVSANRILKGRFWKSREAAAGRQATPGPIPGIDVSKLRSG